MEGEEGEAPFVNGVSWDRNVQGQDKRSKRQGMLSDFTASVFALIGILHIRQGESGIYLVDMIDE